MTCPTCKELLGLSCTHSECPVRASFWCSQCSCYGHLPSECDEVTHVWRPATLEELIPEDVRARWGITTSTYIIWPKASLADAEREIAETNTIVVRKNDRAIRDAMKQRKIPTVHAMDETVDKEGKPKDGNIQLLRKWAVNHGKKVRFIQEER